MNFLVGLLAVVVPGFLGLYVAKNGHSRLITDVFVVFIIGFLGTVFVIFEGINLMIWPFRLLRRLLGFAPRRMDAAEASDLATGRKTTEKRRIVLFDGVCVLCNRFGRFVVSHLPDPNEVSFVPFQDPMANPHVNLKRLEAEFGFKEDELQDRIAVIEGDRILWGPDAVIAIMQWCYAPFPLAKLGLIVPWPIRDAAYLTVAKNRYRWFGTQPLDTNFAKYLCPYLYVKKAFGDGKRD
ncbi:DCC family protein At1g52590, chloroplastic [Hondaea fermentalgiana]|uniref:DCC family protein At1g52590, chloroplastic n=1 Tax=Hondaea fermentalgiana TaxID=2315210 RepID=A0A2R5GTH9_9STRA|nr:DCC family protein At1g52590, chloroplastic [Hondaea fermentalgiana]|eukprot:GBG33885.1 DCC family protein At1g52590, chloroplastic [Hondaea fermentalgiana]